MDVAERDLAFYKQRLAEMTEKESQLEVKLGKMQTTTNENEKALQDLVIERDQLTAQLSTRDLSLEKIEMAAAHVERLWMQLEDNLSMERQAIDAYSAAGKVSDKVSFWERAAAVAITFSVLIASIASVRKYINKRK